MQITDNALARDLFPQDYHCLGDNENRPIKWLAIESLLSKTFTTASDVVSHIHTQMQKPVVKQRERISNIFYFPWIFFSNNLTCFNFIISKFLSFNEKFQKF